MTEKYLRIAKSLILEQDYDNARNILSKIPNNATAKKWLAQIDRLENKNLEIDSQILPVQLPPRLDIVVRNNLTQAETVLWYEQPEPHVFANHMTPDWLKTVIVPLGIMLLFLQIIISESDSTSFIEIAPTLFATLSPFIREQILQRKATAIHYIITNKRGLIIEELKIRDVPPYLEIKVQVIDEVGGFQSLVFHRPPGWQQYIQYNTLLGFIGISKSKIEEAKHIMNKYWNSS